MDDNSKLPDQDFTLAEQSEDATSVEQPNERRRFLQGASLATITALLGVSAIPFHKNMAEGLVPIALADDTEGNAALGKDGLTIHNDRPVNAETAAHLLDDRITPQSRHFIRNNGNPPTSMNVDTWTNWALRSRTVRKSRRIDCSRQKQ